MSIFVDPSKRAGRYLEWKVRIFAVGGTMAVGGIFLDEQWLTGAAIAVLAGGMLLRFLPARDPSDGDGDDEDDVGDGEDQAEEERSDVPS